MVEDGVGHCGTPFVDWLNADEKMRPGSMTEGAIRDCGEAGITSSGSYCSCSDRRCALHIRCPELRKYLAWRGRPTSTEAPTRNLGNAAKRSPMIFELLKDITKLALIVASLDLALRAYVRARLPAWSGPLEKRRVVILCALVLAATAIKVSEDVLGKESGPVDEAILLIIHNHVPPMLTGFFEAVTVTGSSMALVPLAAVATIALLLAKRRVEAMQLATAAVTAPILVYIIKMAVGRARPALWEAQWYWGSSFPSGHTLTVAAISTAAALCVSRIWPSLRAVALWVAFVWTVLVAISRMVLGVHWPTDVLTAACIGAFIPLAVSIAFEVHEGK